MKARTRLVARKEASRICSMSCTLFSSILSILRSIIEYYLWIVISIQTSVFSMFSSLSFSLFCLTRSASIPTPRWWWLSVVFQFFWLLPSLFPFCDIFCWLKTRRAMAYMFCSYDIPFLIAVSCESSRKTLRRPTRVRSSDTSRPGSRASKAKEVHGKLVDMFLGVHSLEPFRGSFSAIL